ncbi:hypothetical protein [Thiocapsa sp. UBA6158]|uniref:hypothetical protein n=1 Tax=Thiocapsa sp. UBA6158 TaxID=1947692 RepID=UPI0025CDA762|nr:hypothetical protein [Thiocapsa sp. UBA6158]
MARYLSAVHGADIPADAVIVDEATWLASQEMDAPRFNADGSLSEIVAPINLEVARDTALAAIDQAAGAVRARYITVAPGQDLTYQRKSAEVAAWLAAADPAPADYPILHAEASACAMPMADVVADALAAEEAWTLVGAAIEGRRMAGKRAVRAATDLPAITAARDAAIDAINTL